MKLWDYLMMYKDYVELEVPDTEIDNIVCIEFDKSTAAEISKDFPYMDKFTQLLCQKVNIDYFVPDGIPVCNFSKLINDNIDLFKKHIKKHWVESMQWVIEDDSGELEYEIIKEFDNVIGGRYGESVNKQYFETLSKCKE